MSAFEDTIEELSTSAPARVIKLPRSAWVTTYAGRPECDVLIGIRLPGQEDADAIEVEALKAMRSALADGDDAAIRAYNETKLVGVVAACISDPEDVNEPHPLFLTPNVLLRMALTPQGVRRIFDEIERLQIDTSPIFREATDADVELFASMLREGAVSSQDPTVGARARRYIAFCLEILTNV